MRQQSFAPRTRTSRARRGTRDGHPSSRSLLWPAMAVAGLRPRHLRLRGLQSLPRLPGLKDQDGRSDHSAVDLRRGRPGRHRRPAAPMETLTNQTYETVIGLEIHVQLLTASKMFCACAVTFGAPPNTLVCPVCLGLPGSLPVLNRKAVDLGLRTAVALGCTGQPTSQL